MDVEIDEAGGNIQGGFAIPDRFIGSDLVGINSFDDSLFQAQGAFFNPVGVDQKIIF
ncbi:hypothetical protein SDC9_144264 [bioreactor metagenome]|uniref:Uncharacterized protein n=1 Tax=bioreactor metagenome TaxID=1076179 RepID=A0A645E6A5_9ZZZZ